MTPVLPAAEARRAEVEEARAGKARARVTLPLPSAASKTTGLKVLPGAYSPAAARLYNGRFSSWSKRFQTRADNTGTNELGS